MTTHLPDGSTGLGVEEAHRRLPELLSRAAKGERIVICRHQQPQAALVPLGDQPASSRCGTSKESRRSGACRAAAAATLYADLAEKPGL